MKEEVLWKVAEDLATVARRQQQLNRQLPIRSSEMGVLIFIDSQAHPITATEIGRFLGVAKPSVTTIVKSLVQSEYVLLLVNEHDQRKKHIQLTKKGKALLEESKCSYQIRLERIAAELGEADFIQFSQLLQRVNSILEEELHK
ncbi:MAG: MarR family winged helix-turn-helix transcriptional regulator [Culicoidibacterales bacterium]